MAYKKYDGKNSMYDIMVRLYAFLVSLGRKEIDEVPELYRPLSSVAGGRHQRRW